VIRRILLAIAAVFAVACSAQPDTAGTGAQIGEACETVPVTLDTKAITWPQIYRDLAVEDFGQAPLPALDDPAYDALEISCQKIGDVAIGCCIIWSGGFCCVSCARGPASGITSCTGSCSRASL
jgi:hypothetical protein